MKIISKRAKGFTLVETVIALGVIAVMLTTFIGIFMPARDNIRRAISAGDGDKVSGALLAELNMVRPSEEKQYSSNKFYKAFEWIKSGNAPGNAVVIYTYRANINKVRSDGTFEPSRDAGAVPGKNVISVMGVRRVNDPLLAEDIAASLDNVFICRLTQVVWDGSKYIKGTPGSISAPNGGQSIASPDKYLSSPKDKEAWGAEILCEAEFWPVVLTRPNVRTFQNFNFDKRKPIFVRNLAIRR